MADCSKFADRQRQSFCLQSCCAYVAPHTHTLSVSKGRRDRRLPLETRWISSARYIGIWPHNAWRTRQASLNSTHVIAAEQEASAAVCVSVCLKGKGPVVDTALIHVWWIHAQEHFTMSEVAADWHKLMIPPYIMHATGWRLSVALKAHWNNTLFASIQNKCRQYY